mmetsp:Transcript_63486/g.160119  ORF Transcript_63486/g.160119 Transcript_63486/m.160119 type:complete len:89 (-) Transcript_63486:18-284(-)
MGRTRSGIVRGLEHRVANACMHMLLHIGMADSSATSLRTCIPCTLASYSKRASYFSKVNCSVRFPLGLRFKAPALRTAQRHQVCEPGG